MHRNFAFADSEECPFFGLEDYQSEHYHIPSRAAPFPALIPRVPEHEITWHHGRGVRPSPPSWTAIGASTRSLYPSYRRSSCFTTHLAGRPDLGEGAALRAPPASGFQTLGLPRGRFSLFIHPNSAEIYASRPARIPPALRIFSAIAILRNLRLLMVSPSIHRLLSSPANPDLVLTDPLATISALQL
jgi:hypothetical protein